MTTAAEALHCPSQAVSTRPRSRSPRLTTPEHLQLTIRMGAGVTFCVRGDREAKIGRRFSTGPAAVQAIRDHCRSNGCSAFIEIYYPGTQLWRQDWIAPDGRIHSVYPGQASSNVIHLATRGDHGRHRAANGSSAP
jgi:hypothetical protein